MSAITTHVLDIAHGRPAAGIEVTLERAAANAPGGWILEGKGVTDTDGRLRSLLPEGAPAHPGTWRLTFATGPYFHAHGAPAFHPQVAITFAVQDDGEHYHVPLLVSPFGYTTYRGS